MLAINNNSINYCFKIAIKNQVNKTNNFFQKMQFPARYLIYSFPSLLPPSKASTNTWLAVRESTTYVAKEESRIC